MGKRNYLLGKGEPNLTQDIILPSGGGPKKHPYTFAEAQTRLGKMLNTVVAGIDALPAIACPNEYAIATIALHPTYIAKSYFPTELLREVGLETVGSRPKQIKPEKHATKKENKETITTEIFVKGTREQFSSWNERFALLDARSKANQQIVEIETISFPDAQTKLKNIPDEENQIAYEAVMHLTESQAEGGYLNMFRGYLSSLGIDTPLSHRFYANGLCFLGIEAPSSMASQIATFSLVRVLRAMPSLRMLRPSMRVAHNKKAIQVALPKGNSLDKNIRVAIFDGGIPATHPLTQWFTPYDFPGMQAPTEEMYRHGVAVTSSFLFGHIDPSKPVPVPYALADHYRVLDDAPGQHSFELFEVLARIKSVLQSKQKKYDFINLSIGPQLPVNDDEVHAWTAMLDQYLANGRTLATIAVGNYEVGEINRVQVPADCVNAMAIGACDLPGDGWKRAPYSAIGPGRSPGLVKPDVVDFGGYGNNPFYHSVLRQIPQILTIRLWG